MRWRSRDRGVLPPASGASPPARASGSDAISPGGGSRPGAFSGSVGATVARNSVWLAACRVLSALISLSAVPFVVARLGIDGYGVWETILAVGGAADLLVLPLGCAVLWRVSQAYGAGDASAARRASGTGLSVGFALAALGVPIALLASPFLVAVFNVPENMRGDAVPALSVAIIVGLANTLQEPFAAVLNGYQRAAVSTVVRTLGMACFYAVGLYGVACGLGLRGLAIGQVVGLCVTLAGLFVMARRVCRQVSWLPRLPGRAEAAAMTKYAGLVFIGALSGALRDRLDRLVLAGLASSTWVGYYGIAQRLARAVMDLCGFVYIPTTAAAGALRGLGDSKAIGRLYTGATVALSVFAGALAATVGGCGDRLTVFWVHTSIPEVQMLLPIILSGYLGAVVLTGPGTAIAKGLGRVEPETAYLVFSAVLNAALTVTLVAAMGPTGTVVASAVSWVAGSVLFAFLLHRSVDLPTSATWRAVRSLGAAAVTGFAMWAVSTGLPVPESRLTGGAVLLGLAVAAVLVHLSMSVLLGVVSPRTLVRRLGGLLKAPGRCTEE